METILQFLKFTHSVRLKFSGGAGVVTPSKPPPPYEQLLPLPTPYFKKFLERSLNDPPPPHFKQLSLLPLHPIHHPFPPPPKNFDHTHINLFLKYILVCFNRKLNWTAIRKPYRIKDFKILNFIINFPGCYCSVNCTATIMFMESDFLVYHQFSYH